MMDMKHWIASIVEVGMLMPTHTVLTCSNFHLDMDECASPNTNNCDQQLATCINTNGSFLCMCNSGYTGLGTNGTCEGTHMLLSLHVPVLNLFINLDVDECHNVSISPCDRNAECLNSIGSFECRCSPGYIGNGFICSKITTAHSFYSVVICLLSLQIVLMVIPDWYKLIAVTVLSLLSMLRMKMKSVRTLFMMSWVLPETVKSSGLVLLKAVLKSVRMTFLEQCVMTAGICLMRLLYVGSSVLSLMVILSHNPSRPTYM